MVFIDTHVHLYSSDFKVDLKEVIKRAVNEGVQKMFLPNIDSESIPGMFSLENEFPGLCYPMMGLHPCSVKDNYNEELLIAEHWLGRKKFYAVGEIGIDLYWDKTYLVQQKDAFCRQIQWAIKKELPIVIHSREAFDETFEIIASYISHGLKGIWHCFSGNLNQANKVIDLGGFILGIGGVLTFKNSGLDKVIEAISLEHIVLETDAPYLAPNPYRGKRNESSYIHLIAKKIAEIKNTSIEEVAEITSFNAKKIFGI